MATAPNFNRLARPYRWLEYLSFGPILQNCRVQFLPALAGCRRALVLGDGDGRFTARLLSDYQDIQVLALDGSPQMLRQLEIRTYQHRSRLRTECADIRSWNRSSQPGAAAAERYDLVVTHFFLDCLSTEEVRDLAQRLNPVVSADALWLVSEFAIPRSAFGHWIAAPAVAALYRIFHWLTGLASQSLPDYQPALDAAGWRLKAQSTRLRGMLVSQLWQREDFNQRK